MAGPKTSFGTGDESALSERDVAGYYFTMARRGESGYVDGKQRLIFIGHQVQMLPLPLYSILEVDPVGQEWRKQEVRNKFQT